MILEPFWTSKGPRHYEKTLRKRHRKTDAKKGGQKERHKQKKLSKSLSPAVSRRPAELSYRRFTELRGLSNTLRYPAFSQGAAD